MPAKGKKAKPKHKKGPANKDHGTSHHATPSPSAVAATDAADAAGFTTADSET